MPDWRDRVPKVAMRSMRGLVYRFKFTGLFYFDYEGRVADKISG